MLADTIEITVHAGALSVENGSVGPITQLFDLSKALDTSVVVGPCYGQDRILVKKEQLPIVVALLEDAHLLYKLPQDGPMVWRGIKTDSVRRRLHR